MTRVYNAPLKSGLMEVLYLVTTETNFLNDPTMSLKCFDHHESGEDNDRMMILRERHLYKFAAFISCLTIGMELLIVQLRRCKPMSKRLSTIDVWVQSK